MIRYANVNVEVEGDGLKAKKCKSEQTRRRPIVRPKTASAAVQTAFRESGELKRNKREIGQIAHILLSYFDDIK